MLGRDHPAATHATCPQTFLSFFLFPRPPTHRETSPRDPFYLHWRHYKDLESLRAGNYVCSQVRYFLQSARRSVSVED